MGKELVLGKRCPRFVSFCDGYREFFLDSQVAGLYHAAWIGSYPGLSHPEDGQCHGCRVPAR